MASTVSRAFRTLLLVGAALTPVSVQAQDNETASDASAAGAPRIAADRMAATLVARLTLDEKLDQLLNTAPAINRLGVPAYNWWTESLHGALGALPTTNFPEPIGLAATFDAPLLHDVAATISTEVRGLHTLARQTGRMGRIGTGLDTWSPNINIFRDPRWGRGQETYGEDPYLAAHMGVAFVTGMQGPDPDLPDVIASPKHFAVHSGPESTRHAANVYVSPHDLEDTYLPAFRAAVVEGRAGSIMCAYNRIDGQPACANDLLLKEHLRGAWGFTGYVVSDCDAVKDISDGHHYAPDGAAAAAAALKAGVDNECNTATLTDTDGLGERYRAALKRGLISEADIDRTLVRLFSARYRNGDLAGIRPVSAVSPSQIDTPAHRALALAASERSLVLLKNAGVLPLQPGVRIAVIGPLGDATRVLRGNYSSALSAPPISIADGLRQAIPGATVTVVPFGPSFTDGDRVPTSALRAPDGQPGLLARYYNPVTPPPKRFAPGSFGEATKAMRFATKPVATRREPDVAARSLDLAKVSDHHRVVWTGFLVPPATGTYRLGLTGFAGSMTLNGAAFVDLTKAGYGSLPTMKVLQLEAGHRYPITVTGDEHVLSGIDLVWKRIAPDPGAALKAAAADADVFVAAVGLTSDLEAEETSVTVPGFAGGDKTTLDLPADQQALLEQARATGKPVIVVAMNGSPINLAWAKDNAAAILEAWYPGQSGGLAIGNVLSGKVNPAGRLPLTFYRSLADLPPFGDYAMAGRTYRYFTGTPVYPFGYGLSYTSFAYAPLTLTPATGGAEHGLRVTTEVRNTGKRAGDEVVQLYLTFPDVPGAPRVALRGYQRIALAPGQRRGVTFDLSPRDLSAVTADGTREVMAGQFRVSVGSGQPDTDVPVRSANFRTSRVEPLPL
ncbi:glycoside hydrolase family 3 C-terminal domain-containing protein [Sphingomonas sp. TREG-RG-20F-R18-01]|uniref:glycoside hydrolase family 3 C-terminal domain-containing protein n=1 Tax=Sphingomonas sp. TREG-RG-20F-R18-01 TaxID=2914982 RepID=UPI001F572A93|nr:glycoside hydrolase family 3 C-terminal domain-containing protein [Sphingomonas sp. TREG-RG-20F-R18-01]